MFSRFLFLIRQLAVAGVSTHVAVDFLVVVFCSYSAARSTFLHELEVLNWPFYCDEILR